VGEKENEFNRTRWRGGTPGIAESRRKTFKFWGSGRGHGDNFGSQRRQRVLVEFQNVRKPLKTVVNLRTGKKTEWGRTIFLVGRPSHTLFVF